MNLADLRQIKAMALVAATVAVMTVAVQRYLADRANCSPTITIAFGPSAALAPVAPEEPQARAGIPLAEGCNERTDDPQVVVGKAAALQPYQTTLTPELVVAKIEAAYTDGIGYCYKVVAKQAASARGRLTFQVDANGDSKQGVARGFSPDLDHCLGELITSWRFPIPKDGEGEPIAASFAVPLTVLPCRDDHATRQ